MTAQKQVVYPSESSYSGSAQLNLGPFTAGPVKKLLQARLRGQINFLSVQLGLPAAVINYAMYGVQYGVSGYTPHDIITSNYDATWLIRQHAGGTDQGYGWVPGNDAPSVMDRYGLPGWWAGQEYVGATIDYYLSVASPLGSIPYTFNLQASIEIWFV